MFASFFTWAVDVLEFAGAVALLAGFALSLVMSVRRWITTRSGADAFTVLRRMFASSILLGLEILVAADLIRTVTSVPSLSDALILGLIVLIRTVLSISIQIEIEGVLPWKRALLPSGLPLLRASSSPTSDA